MQFILYTDKTVAQCISAVNERLQSSRSNFSGWTDKRGEFTIATSLKIARRFDRTTRLNATVEREAGVTVVKGYVSEGVDRSDQLLILGAVGVVALVLFASGSVILAILTVLVGAALYIPFTGDNQNSALLIKEVKSILKAKDSPPSKKPTQIKSASPKPTAPKTNRPATPRQTPLGANLPKKPSPAKRTTAKKTTRK